MLVRNSRKIVIKLGSTTVVDSRGKFKTKWVTSLIKDIKKFRSGKDFVIVSSGAIALGHPLGMSGARLVLTATEELHQKNDNKIGLCTMCVGVGQGSSIILEKI